MQNHSFINHISNFKKLLNFEKKTLIYIDELINEIKQCKKKGGKILIFGNGGSAAIASHFAVDMTKVAKIRTVNFNEYDLITCFANDYGFENWISKALEFYSDRNDLIILISSSGKSLNMIKGAKQAKKLKLNTVTFTGFKKNNPLKKLGKINIWVNAKNYNYVENIHQIILLSITDLIAKKS